MDCAPQGGPTGTANEASVTALGKFRNAAASRFGGPVPTQRLATVKDWQVFAELYRQAIADRLGGSISEVEAFVAELATVADGVLDCGSRWVKAGRMEGHVPNAGGRLDLLIFPEGGYPLVGEEETPGESVYDEANYRAAEVDFSKDPRAAGGDAPVEPDPEPRPDLYKAYQLLHHQAWAALGVQDIETYESISAQREQAWNDYLEMAGSEAGKLHEEMRLEVLYSQYLRSHEELLAHAVDNEAEQAEHAEQAERYQRLYETREDLWASYEEDGGTGVQVHDDSPPTLYWEFELNPRKEKCHMTAYNLGLLAALAYEGVGEGDKVDTVFSKMAAFGADRDALPALVVGKFPFSPILRSSTGRYRDYKGFDDESTDTQGFCVHNGKNIIISIRGTSGAYDIAVDLDARRADFPHVPAAEQLETHAGFARGLETSLDSDTGASRIEHILDYIRQFGGQGQPVFVTGHSLGAALAFYVGCVLETKLKNPVTLYNFGQPRCGNRTFAERFFGRINYHRYAHTLDIVPMVPLTPLLAAVTVNKLDEILSGFTWTADYYTHFGAANKLIPGSPVREETDVIETIEKAMIADLVLLYPTLVGTVLSQNAHSMVESYLKHVVMDLRENVDSIPEAVFSRAEIVNALDVAEEHYG